MKSTQEERDAWKAKRRFAGWRDLLADMHRRCRRSQKTLDTMRNAMGAFNRDGKIALIQDAIRRAN